MRIPGIYLLVWSGALIFASSLIAKQPSRSDGSTTGPTQPNIVFLVSEDNSSHYLRLFDENGAPTPCIEALARGGLVFRNAFSNSPVCSVARTTLATGCYAPRIGAQYHRGLQKVPMPDDLEMFPAYLRANGYYTTNRQKTDYNVVAGDNVWDESGRTATWQNRQQDQPFFHMQTFTQSHESRLHFPPGDVFNKPTINHPQSVITAPYHPRTETFAYTHARYLDCIMTIDREVGEAIETLRDNDLLDDTFIFYFSDHGGVLPRSKGFVYESGLKVPLVVSIPENFRHLIDAQRGTDVTGFVSFVDFGPTVLNLCGVPVPDGIDGRPFLGPGTELDEVNQRNKAFGYADRFGEKLDLVRSIRIGNYKYIRNFTPFNFDGLHNNYRYLMPAYTEWRELFLAGELNPVQRRFFEPKSVEELYDLSSDPHEVDNLIGSDEHLDVVVKMRDRLDEIMSQMPDLSLYPESHLLSEAFDNPASFGLQHQTEIIELLNTANLAIGEFESVSRTLHDALLSEAPWQRYRAVIACSSHGTDALELAGIIRNIAENDQNNLVRARAAEFLGLTGAGDPRATLREALSRAASVAEAVEILNTAVLLQDGEAAIDCGIATKDIPGSLIEERSGVESRLRYLAPDDN